MDISNEKIRMNKGYFENLNSELKYIIEFVIF